MDLPIRKIINMKSLPVCLLLFLSPLSFAEWELPSPDKVQHPGAEASPVSSPLSYPDEAGFQDRAKVIIEGVSTGSLDKWRRGYFTGGDPGKYLPGQAMAKLLLNPEDPEPAKYFNDDRSYKEHYHFAAVNWARFLPIFGEQVLTAETQQKLADAAFKYGAYGNPNGTDNHKVMWWTSTNVLPHYLVGGRGLAHRSQEATLTQGKQDLHAYVKGLYLAGQGEWDSSIYLMFVMNGLMNIYDFSPDEESRLLAKAGLDILAAPFALKYTNGSMAGPNQRGFPKPGFANIADQTGYLWWNASLAVTPELTRNWLYTMHAITSSYRPNRVLSHLATKDTLTLPAEQRNSKANYWHGMGWTPTPGASHESLYIAPTYTMGSLWDAHASQHSRFSIVTRDGHVFSGGHPRKSNHKSEKTGLGFQDGSGRYLQSAQAGPLYLCLAKWPTDEEAAYSFFGFPEDLTPKEIDGWQVFESGNTVIAVLPISRDRSVEVSSTDLGKNKQIGLLKFPAEDQQAGFLVWTGDPSILPLLSSVKTAFDPEKSHIIIQVPGVHTIDFSFSPDDNGLHGNQAADVIIDGQAVDLTAWPIFDGPFIQQVPGKLRVSDGNASFIVDFTGDLPVYR